jgi:magnesium-transporting ATPase (P-type)
MQDALPWLDFAVSPAADNHDLERKEGPLMLNGSDLAIRGRYAEDELRSGCVRHASLSERHRSQRGAWQRKSKRPSPNEVDKKTDGTVYAGSTVRSGEATGVVGATGARTYFARTTQLVEGAHPKLHVEQVTSRIVRWLLMIVGSLSAVTFVTALGWRCR